MSSTNIKANIPCRICKSEAKPDPTYDKLCMICGQKREVYVAAILSGGVSGSVESVFKRAEECVAFDRSRPATRQPTYPEYTK